MVYSFLVRVSSRNVAPAANTVLADTGALAAGNYDIEVDAGASDTVALGKHIEIQHRNAANGANLHTFVIPTPNSNSFVWKKVAVALNERIRGQSGVIAGAASVYTVHIIVRLSA